MSKKIPERASAVSLLPPDLIDIGNTSAIFTINTIFAVSTFISLAFYMHPFRPLTLPRLTLCYG